MNSLNKLKSDLLEIADPEIAEKNKRFFKTGRNEYAENDVFIGIRNPELRELSKKFKSLKIDDIRDLLRDYRHEFRLEALFILVNQYTKTKDEALVQFYLENLDYVNNWDLVDGSCREILGVHCYKIDNYTILKELANSENLWKRRIGMVSNWYPIKKGVFHPTFTIAKTLLKDPEDIIQKAVGWMLKEIWNRGGETELEDFLLENGKDMSRTAYRISIEKMPPIKKQYFMELTKES